ncbi:MAG: thiamine phosphate synthase [Alphaproteobacteria bacterium]
MRARRTKFCLLAPEPAAGEISASFAAALETGLVEAVILPWSCGNDLAREQGAALAPLTARHQAALLVIDDVDLASQIGAGVVATQAQPDPGAIRARLGDDALVGIVAGTTRHGGLEAAQAGADFVGLGFLGSGSQDQDLAALVELVTWWDEMIEIPCVAFGADTPQVAMQLLEAGADTVALSAKLWMTGDPAATLRDIAGQ